MNKERLKSSMAMGGRNVSEEERLASLGAGAAFAAVGFRTAGVTRVVSFIVSGALLVRGATGHCPVYQSLGISSADTPKSIPLDAQPSRATAAITIAADRPTVWSAWRDLESLGQSIGGVASVENEGERSHWSMKFPLNRTLRWTSQITAEEENERVEWVTTEDSDLEHSGVVTFRDAPGDRGTEVSIHLQYRAPAGALGRALSRAGAQDAHTRLRDALRDFKARVEAGESPTTDGQSDARGERS